MEQANVLMLESMQIYEEYIQKARDIGATKKSYDRSRQEFHQYYQLYPVPSFAVDVCRKAYENAVMEKMKENAEPDYVKEYGRVTYCTMLPKLINRESIRDFIACVVHGMAVGIIPGPDGTRLLYGAQVAQAALPAVRKWRKNTAPTTSKPPANCTQTAPKSPSNSAVTNAPSTT